MNQYRPCIVSSTMYRDTYRIAVKMYRYTPTKWCVIQKTKTKTKSEFAEKMNTGHSLRFIHVM